MEKRPTPTNESLTDVELKDKKVQPTCDPVQADAFASLKASETKVADAVAESPTKENTDEVVEKTATEKSRLQGTKEPKPVLKPYTEALSKLHEAKETWDAESLWELRQEVVLNSMFTSDFQNSFGVDPHACQDFFDGYVSDLEDRAKEAGKSSDDIFDIIKEFDNKDNLYSWYTSLSAGSDSEPLKVEECIKEEVTPVAESTSINIKDRKELAKTIIEAKKAGRKFKISRCMEEGFRYTFSYTDAEQLAESISSDRADVYNKLLEALSSLKDAFEKMSAVWEIDEFAYDTCNDIFKDFGMGDYFSKSLDEYAPMIDEWSYKLTDMASKEEADAVSENESLKEEKEVEAEPVKEELTITADNTNVIVHDDASVEVSNDKGVVSVSGDSVSVNTEDASVVADSSNISVDVSKSEEAAPAPEMPVEVEAPAEVTTELDVADNLDMVDDDNLEIKEESLNESPVEIVDDADDSVVDFDDFDDDIELPSSVLIDPEALFGPGAVVFDDDDIEEDISNYLSDTYGFLHFGFSYYVDDDGIHVENIEWDTSSEDDIEDEDIPEESRLHHLKDLYDMEPEDLTVDEIKELHDAGMLTDSLNLKEDIKDVRKEITDKMLDKFEEFDVGYILNKIQDSAEKVLSEDEFSDILDAANKDLEDCEGTDALYLNGDAYDWKEFELKKDAIIDSYLKYYSEDQLEKINKDLDNIDEALLKEDPTYELSPRFDSRKSFYGKAKVDVLDDGTEVLYSYGTPVCKITKDGKVTLLRRGYLGWSSSQTTLRHVKDFLKQHGIDVASKKELAKKYPTEEF